MKDKPKHLSKRALVVLAWIASDTSVYDLMKYRNAGKKTVKEVRDFIQETIGVKLREY